MTEAEKTEKPVDPYQKYKDFKWENPDEFRNGPMSDEKGNAKIFFVAYFS